MDHAVTAELVTARDYIRWGATRMQAAGVSFGHGTDNAIDEAAYLTAFALHLSPRLPDGLLDARLTVRERERVVALIEQRVESRRPAAYLTGEAWFAGLRFVVDERVLVPRSPLAELIERAFEPWLSEPPATVLDLCTGSGCIAIACAALLGAEATGVDISEDALAVARANAAAHGVRDRVSWVRSDLYTALGAAEFDLIVTNPPYVGRGEWAALPPEYRAEPELALRSGDRGLDVPLRILAGAAEHLAPGGVLIMEVGASARVLEATLPRLALTWVAFERGGEGVCVVERDALVAAGEETARALAAESDLVQ